MRAKRTCMECKSTDKTNGHIHVKMHEHVRNANRIDKTNVQIHVAMHEHVRNANRIDKTNVHL